MTLATSAAPLNSARRDASVWGTRAVVSTQQLMGVSKLCRQARSASLPRFDRVAAPLVSMPRAHLASLCSLQRALPDPSRPDRLVLAHPLDRGSCEDMPPANLLSNA